MLTIVILGEREHEIKIASVELIQRGQWIFQ